jgi:hypothetical protein
MPFSLLFPLDQIKPTEILTRYSEWVYFTLILVFFISVAGITLRKHFDKPYVKPLIIAVGLMLTVGVFKFKDSLTTIFGGWGIIGTVLLVMMAATIPYGLCRGFGLSGTKAFFLTYILLYILSWFQFPKIYYTLSDKNLGLINLALLILFVVAIFKVVKFSKLSPSIATDLSGTGALEPEIGREIEIQGKEQRLIKKHAGKLTKLEIRTIGDIAELLAEIHQIIKNHRNNLPKEERKKITGILNEILKKETIFTKAIQNLRKILQRIGFADASQLREQKVRMAKAEGKERELLKKEIAEEEEKLKIEKSILELEERLNQYMNSFKELLSQSVEHLRASPYPFDAEPYLVKARGVLKNIADMLTETKELEKKLINVTKTEKRLLKKEKEAGE